MLSESEHLNLKRILEEYLEVIGLFRKRLPGEEGEVISSVVCYFIDWIQWVWIPKIYL